MPAHNDSESADFGGPEHLRITCGLGAAFDDTLMDGAELIHVVALVGAAAGVEEREQAGDQERGFVVGNGVRPGEDGAGLAVEAAAIGEEDGIFGGVLFGKLGRLADETICEDYAIGNFRAGTGDKVMCENSRSDINGVLWAAIDGAVFKPACGFDGRSWTDFHILDNPAMHYR